MVKGLIIKILLGVLLLTTNPSLAEAIGPRKHNQTQVSTSGQANVVCAEHKDNRKELLECYGKASRERRKELVSYLESLGGAAMVTAEILVNMFRRNSSAETDSRDSIGQR